MRHLLAACVLAGSAGGLLAAPVPKAAKKAADFFPLAVGHKWEYTGTYWASAEVTAVADSDDKQHKDYTVKFAGAAGQTDDTIVFRMTADGVLMVSNSPAERVPYARPVKYLALPLKAGDKWQRVFDTGGHAPATFDFEVGESEAVTVNGTAYTAARVMCVGTAGSADREKSADWYAPGVGLVKMTQGGKTVLELKSFTPAGSKAKK